MSRNKKAIEAYLSAADRSKAAPLLTEDVEWVEWVDGVPVTGARIQGKAAFLANFGEDELRSEITRMTEENDVVVAEGMVEVRKKDGKRLRVRFCDIFELQGGKIHRLDSFGALVKDAE